MNYHTELNIQSGKYFNPRILFNLVKQLICYPMGKELLRCLVFNFYLLLVKLLGKLFRIIYYIQIIFV